MEANNGVHVVLLPVPEQGHITPMVCIARYLAGFDICVTLALAARSHASLMSAAAGRDLLGSCRNVGVEVLPDGLPADLKQQVSLAALGASLATIRQGAHDMLKRLLDLQLHQARRPAPCCLIADSLLAWAPDLARLFGLPHVSLWTSAASSLSVGIHIPDLVARGYLPIRPDSQYRKLDFIPGLSSLCPADLPPLFANEEGFQAWLSSMPSLAFKHAKHADRVLVNSIYELESVVVDSLRSQDGVRIDPIGPLFLISPSDSSNASLLEVDHSCLSWLDEQEAASVLYISFGSVSSIDGQVYEELAHGLEASGMRFLWVIRPGELTLTSDKSALTLMEEVLPHGFLQRTAQRGLVISWAPQVDVLAHASVAAFLTHCGWNSVLESLSNGVPMLGFPQQVDQTTNLKHIVYDWKVGLSLLPYECKEQQQPLHRSHVQASVTAIMQGEGAASLRKCALKWRDIAVSSQDGGGFSNCNLQKLANDIISGHFKRVLK